MADTAISIGTSEPATKGAGWSTTRHAPLSAARRLMLALLVLAVLVSIVAPLFSDPLDSHAPAARAGVLDLAGRGTLDRPIALRGQWGLTWLAGAGGPPAGTRMPIAVPGQWSIQRAPDGRLLPMSGTVRYELLVRNIAPGSYTLHVPPFYAANRVYIDGQLVSQRGTLGTSAATTRYRVRAESISFPSAGGDVRIGLEVAAWLHRDNGIVQPPVLGSAQVMDDWFSLKWARQFLYTTSLILIGALGLAVFLFRQQDKASLWFGLACLTFIPSASMFGFDNLLMIQLPGLSFRGMLLLKYPATTAALLFFLANAHELFPHESPRSIFRALVVSAIAISVIEIAHLLRGNTMAASVMGNYFFIVSFATVAWCVVIVVRAVRRRREGAPIFLLGLLLWVASFVPGTLIAANWITSDRIPGFEFTALGVLMLLFSHVVLMAERWSLAISRAERVSNEMRQLVEVNTAIASDLDLAPLIRRIVEAASRVIGADRASLFLRDPRSGDLTSLVAEGVGTRSIRIAEGSGLAGHALAAGTAINLADAYDDPRFDRSVDETTGYRTRSIVTVPLAARDGRALGVMQALNRLDGQPFDDDDVSRMAAFGAQAAIAIDNARLFGEVVAARNFDDSILRSMSGGVIALDRSSIITKVNAAAAEILGVDGEAALGLNARDLLAEYNPWLIAEIEAVAVTGESKLLLDIELRTLRDRPPSVNLSIVPLDGEEGAAGVLLVIEDISADKRMQGAMRRFMTQEVVDQIMGQEDDLLFGSACDAAVLFADIRGFTTMAEQLSARQTVEMLNELFTELFEAVSESGGMLDKYIGDAIMAVYGAPISSGRDALNAVISAGEMLRQLDLVNATRAKRSSAPMRLGIGVATGEVVAGTIGSPKRMDYTVIGDSVNLAARLQELTKTYGVELLVCERTARAAGLQFELREIDTITVRGRSRAERIFEVMTREAADPAARVALLEAYAEGREALANHRRSAAVAAFERAVGIDPDDGPSRHMLTRARA
jgi:adenylate cyclase